MMKPMAPIPWTTTDLMEALAPIETYWAFPGAAVFENLRRLLAQENIED